MLVVRPTSREGGAPGKVFARDCCVWGGESQSDGDG